MILSEKVVSAMKRNSRVKNRIALEMDSSVQTVERWIKENEPNGRLTAVRLVQIIAEELEVNESEILENEVVSENEGK
jgi:hypothetical protein